MTPLVAADLMLDFGIALGVSLFVVGAIAVNAAVGGTLSVRRARARAVIEAVDLAGMYREDRDGDAIWIRPEPESGIYVFERERRMAGGRVAIWGRVTRSTLEDHIMEFDRGIIRTRRVE